MDKLINLIMNNVHVFKKGAIAIVLAVCVYLIFMAVKNIFSKKVFKLIMNITKKTKNDFDDKLIIAFDKPIRVLYTTLSIFISFRVFMLSFGISMKDIEFDDKFLSSIGIAVFAWGFYNLTLEKSVLFDSMKKKFGIKVDRILFPFISKCFRLVIISFAVLSIAPIWGINIQTFVTGLGLGGLAFSLAAKDAAANVIAGIIIIAEKPFNIGDWISASSIEGIVEDISFRSTKIRTFAQEIVTVPNSDIANASITNYSRRGKRRISFNLGVMYSTPKEKIQTCIDRIEIMLRNHDDIHKETIIVNFNQFNSSSLDIFLYFFTKTTDFDRYLMIKQDVNFKILDILNEEGVSCAFPSTSIYVETPINHNNNEFAQSDKIYDVMREIAADKEKDN